MTTLPIPFLTAFLLVILAGSNHQQLKQTPTGRVFALFLYVNAVAMVCIGFRWSHDLKGFLPVAAVLAVISSALLYLAFCSLGRAGPVIKLSRDWPHLIPSLLILVALLIQPRWIEIVLVATKISYAGLLIQLALHAPSSLQLVRLSWLNNSQHALWGAVALLVLSVGVDIGIAIDFALYEGRHAERLVGIANLFIVLLLGLASVLAGRGMSASAHMTNTLSMDSSLMSQAFEASDKNSEASDKNNEASDKISEAADQSDLLIVVDSNVEFGSVEKTNLASENEDTSEVDAQLLLQLNHLLVEQRLYADTELNLQKLARKAGVPARIVSRAINNHAGKNVSQWVNSARVDAVCELLSDENVSVTQAMHEAGFLTKSNFNREFRRLRGCSPSQWRMDN